jgi:glycosyltransferase involved in cell wall biosynthesis
VDTPSELHDHLRELGEDVRGAERLVHFKWSVMKEEPGPTARMLSMSRYHRALAAEIRHSRPDLVHANSLYTFSDGLVARALRRPVLLHVHETHPGWKATGAHAASFLSGMEVVAVSQACADRVAWRGHRPRIAYESAPVPEVVEHRRNGHVVVGTIGWVSKRKGTDTFVEAARLVAQEDPSIEFRVVGDFAPGPDWEWGHELMGRATAAGIRHQPEADVFHELQEWDLMVMPSRQDPFPLVVLEAMASEVPVVGSTVGGIQEQVTAETGLLAGEEDPAAFAEAILTLARDPDRRRAMGEAARRRVAENFTPEHQAASLDAGYRAALGRATG